MLKHPAKHFIQHPALQISGVLLLLASSWAMPNLLGNPQLGGLAQAQSLFPIPKDLPADTSLVIEGSSSMGVLNQALKAEFEAQYPDSQVQLSVNDSDRAIARLIAGEIDLAAIARPLTPAEQAQGLEAVFVSREKMAIVVGSENPFSGNLSFVQFAQIFRGEITDWSEVGGEPGPIRLVDRPTTSDTRRSLGAYSVFQAAPFTTGDTAVRLGADDTAAVITTLGNDGLSYASASQVMTLDTVKVVPMHQTLPDDPRYPYSQPRGYVYRVGDDAAKTLAFLGLATSEPGKAAIATARTAEAAGVVAAIATSTPTSPQNAANAAGGANGGNSTNGHSEADASEAAGTTTLDSELNSEPSSDSASDSAAQPQPDAADNPDLAASSAGAGNNAAENNSAGSDSAGTGTTGTTGTPTAATWASGSGESGNNSAGTGATDNPTIASADGDRNATEQNSEKAVPWWLVGLLAIPLIGLLVAGLLRRDRAQTAGSPVSPPAPPTPAPASSPASTSPSPPATTPASPAPTPAPEAGSGSAAGEAIAGAGLAAGLAATAQKPTTPASGAGEPTEPKTPPVTPSATPTTPTPVAPAPEPKPKAPLTPIPTPATEPEPPSPEAVPPAPISTDKPEPELVAQPEANPIPSGADGMGAMAGAGLAAGLGAGLAAAAIGGDSTDSVAEPTPTPAGAVTQRTDCEVQHLTVDNRRHCFLLSPSQMEVLQNTAASERLTPGTYVIRIKAGGFNDNAPRSWAQPMVMLWIYGGVVINHKTQCQVPATWSSLNGYDDSLTLTVVESCVVSALFFDSYVEDNTGEVTLAIAQLYT